MKTTAVAVILALVGFLIGNIWIFLSADMFVRYFYEARMVALTHVFTLGWVSLMIFGVLRQLGPVAFGMKLYGERWIGVAIGIWIPAVAAMVVGFATLRYELAAAATSVLFVLSLVIFVVFVSGFRGVRLEPPHAHLVAALLYFAAAAVIGEWMGLAKGYDVPLQASFHRTLFAHIHLAGAGWAGMMILAVMSRLFPQPHLRHPLQARIRFIAFNVGLIGLAAGLLSGGEWYPIVGSILALACICYAVAFIPVLMEFSQPSDRSTTFLVTSWICLGVVALIGLAFNVVTHVQLQFVYGFLYFFGWLSFMILGMLYRIIPTHLSKLLTARGVTAIGPMRRAFVDPDLQIVVWAALVLGLVVSSAAIFTENVVLFRLGWAAWLTGMAGFVFGLVRLGIELRRILR
ncbi:MAG: hypothetical protein HY646_13485 [Acidobacteria bacterium]|nr:hypothetical protein [Acidobacteriota bacterium]